MSGHRILCVGMLWWTGLAASGEELVVKVDASAAPEHRPWAEKAAGLMRDWHPRLVNLLLPEGQTAEASCSLTIRRSATGVGATSGSRIVVSSGWIEKHPEDFGLVIHELVHVLQAYPKPRPVWITEGIADYLRWAVFEGKPLAWFPLPADPKGYQRGYRATAGFLLWLESSEAPGIVRRLNQAMVSGGDATGEFERMTGAGPEELWRRYQRARQPVAPSNSE